MKSFENVFFNRLINSNGFYIKEYYSRLLDKKCYVAVKNADGGLYAVAVCSADIETVVLSEAYDFMKTSNQKFLLNAVILADDEYVYTENSNVRRLIINTKKNTIISCDNSCEPLRKIMNSIVYKTQNKKRKHFRMQHYIWNNIN